MRILLKLELDCAPDAAWRRSAAQVFRAVSAPFTTFESLEPDGFPASWSEGEHIVRAKAFGVAEMGDQSIDPEFLRAPATVCARCATRVVVCPAR